MILCYSSLQSLQSYKSKHELLTSAKQVTQSQQYIYMLQWLHAYLIIILLLLCINCITAGHFPGGSLDQPQKEQKTKEQCVLFSLFRVVHCILLISMDTLTTFSTMRVRDLRLYLIRAGIAESDVNRILDKKELISMAQGIVDAKLWWQQAHQVLVSIGIGMIALLMFQYREPLFATITAIIDWVSDRLYPLRKRVKHITDAYCYRCIPAFFFQSLCLIADIYSMYLSCSSLATWILPYSSPMRFYLAPALYIPLSLPTSTGHRFDTSSYSLNVGPMVTLSILRFITHRIHRYARWLLKKNRQQSDRAQQSDADNVCELRRDVKT